MIYYVLLPAHPVKPVGPRSSLSTLPKPSQRRLLHGQLLLSYILLLVLLRLLVLPLLLLLLLLYYNNNNNCLLLLLLLLLIFIFNFVVPAHPV